MLDMATESQGKLSDRARSELIRSQRSIRMGAPVRIIEINRSYTPVSHIISNQVHLDDRLDAYNLSIFMKNWRRTTHSCHNLRLEVTGKSPLQRSLPYGFLARCNSLIFNLRVSNQSKPSAGLFAKRFRAIKNLERAQLTFDVSDQITSSKPLSKSIRLLSSVTKSLTLDIVDEGLAPKDASFNEVIRLLYGINDSKIQSFGLNLMYSTKSSIEVLCDLLKTKLRKIVALDLLLGEPIPIPSATRFSQFWDGFQELEQLKHLTLAFRESYSSFHIKDGFLKALPNLKNLSQLIVCIGGTKLESDALIAELHKTIKELNLEQFSLYFKDATLICEENLHKLICSFSKYSLPQNVLDRQGIYNGRLELDFKREKGTLVIKKMLANPSDTKSEGVIQNILILCDSANTLIINFPEKQEVSGPFLQHLSGCIRGNKCLHELNLDLSLADEEAGDALNQVLDSAAELNSLLVFSIVIYCTPENKTKSSLIDHIARLLESQPSLTAVSIDIRDLNSTIAHYSQIMKAIGTNRCLESLNLDLGIAPGAFYDLKCFTTPLKKCPKLEVLSLYLKGGLTLGLTGNLPNELNDLKSLGVFHLQIEDKSCSRKEIIEFFSGMRKKLVYQQTMNSIGLFLLAKGLPDFSTEELIMYKYRLSALKLPENWKKEYLVSIAGNFSLSIYYSLWRRNV